MQGSKQKRMMRAKWSAGMSHSKEFIDFLEIYHWQNIDPSKLKTKLDKVIFQQTGVSAELSPEILSPGVEVDPQVSKQLKKFTLSGYDFDTAQINIKELADKILSHYDTLKPKGIFSYRGASENFIEEIRGGFDSDNSVEQEMTMRKLTEFVRRGYLSETGLFGGSKGLTLHKAVIDALDETDKSKLDQD